MMKNQTIDKDSTQLSIELEADNAAYRRGDPASLPDAVYDYKLSQLEQIDPDHPLLNTVEPEPPSGKRELIRHERPMLSTDKARTQKEVDAYCRRIQSAAEEIGLHEPKLEITSKLDGLAARWDGVRLVKRGDGQFGELITDAIDRGLLMDKTVLGDGEIVVDDDFFVSHIRDRYDMPHPRNYISGFIEAESNKKHHIDAISEGAIRFVPYSTLPSLIVTPSELAANWEAYLNNGLKSPYRTDGLVVRCVDADLFSHMGANNKFHRGMVALKCVTDSATAEIHGVEYGVGRSGRLTPVLLIEPTQISGATVSRCTGHNGEHMIKHGLGPGAKALFVRSGEVIPYHVTTTEPSPHPFAMPDCPKCGTPSEWSGPYLQCPNVGGCPAQRSAAIEFFFERIGVKGFGPVACDSIVKTSPSADPKDILTWSESDFVRHGISPGTAKNILDSIALRKTQTLLITHVVAALGHPRLGRGLSEKIIKEHRIDQWPTLTKDDLVAIKGIAEITADIVLPHLAGASRAVHDLDALGFTIDRMESNTSSSISGLTIVFTGSMPKGRKAMEQEAVQMGASVSGSVSKKTDLLVYGENAGSKLDKAQSLNVKTISLEDYGVMLSGG